MRKTLWWNQLLGPIQTDCPLQLHAKGLDGVDDAGEGGSKPPARPPNVAAGFLGDSARFGEVALAVCGFGFGLGFGLGFG